MRGVLTRPPLVEAQTQSTAPLLSHSYHSHRCIMGSSLMSLPLVNDRRLGIGVKHHLMRHSKAQSSSSRPPHLPTELHVAFCCAVRCWFAFAFFPRGFGRETSFFQSRCRAHATTSQTPQRQHRQQTSIESYLYSVLSSRESQGSPTSILAPNRDSQPWAG